MNRRHPRSTLFPYTTLFRSHQVPKVRLHRGDVRLRLRVGELRDRDGGQDADDYHHNQQLNECETITVHLTLLPLKFMSSVTRILHTRKNACSGIFSAVDDAIAVACITD